MANKMLTIENLKKLDAKTYNDKKEIIVNNFQIVVDIHFRPSRIQDMIADMLLKQDEAKKQGLEVNIFSLYLFYLIKHFSSVGDSLKDSTLQQDLSVYNLLLDNGFTKAIIEVFTEHKEELTKVNDAMKAYGENIDILNEQLKKEIEEKAENVENVEVVDTEDK